MMSSDRVFLGRCITCGSAPSRKGTYNRSKYQWHQSAAGNQVLIGVPNRNMGDSLLTGVEMTIEKPKHHWKTHPLLGEDAGKLKLWNSLPRFQGFVPSEHLISAAQWSGPQHPPLPAPIVDCFYKAVEGSSIFLFSQTSDLLFASWVPWAASHSFLKGMFQFSTNCQGIGVRNSSGREWSY